MLVGLGTLILLAKLLDHYFLDLVQMISHLPLSSRFLIGLLVCLGFSLAAMRWIAPLGWTDHPRGRRQHDRPTPRTGGLALLAALGLGQALGALSLPLGRGEWGVVYAMGLMGVLDDRFDLRARWKAMASFVAAAILAWLTWDVLRQAGPHLPLFTWHLATHTGLAVVLLWAWYWSVPQACNLIDGMNGLALGFFLLLAFSMDLPMGDAGHGAYLLGALLALMLLNWPKGWQFLGDSGSLTLGALFAVLGVHLLGTTSLNRMLWAFGYPIMDVLMVIAIRLTNGRSLGEGDRSHFHHQWQSVLRSRSQLPLVMTLLPAAACMQSLQTYQGHQFIAWAGACWLLAAGTWFYFRSTGFIDRQLPITEDAPSGSMVELNVRTQLASASSGEHMAFVAVNRRNDSSHFSGGASRE